MPCSARSNWASLYQRSGQWAYDLGQQMTERLDVVEFAEKRKLLVEATLVEADDVTPAEARFEVGTRVPASWLATTRVESNDPGCSQAH